MKGKHFAALGLALLMLLALTACSSSAPSSNSMGDEYSGNVGKGTPIDPALNGGADESGENTAGDLLLAADPGRKLIWTGSVSVENTDYDQAMAALNALLADCGGYIESSQVQGAGSYNRLRSADVVVRVPSDRFGSFISRSGQMGHVLNQETSSEDVTDQYFDLEAHLKMLEMERGMLQEAFDKTTDMTNRLEILDKLTAVQYEIERLTGTLRKYDGLVDYATVSVHVREVAVISEGSPVLPQTLGQQIARRFSESLRGVGEGSAAFLVWLIGALPYLAILGLLTYLTVFLIRLGRKRAAKRRGADGGH
ncbi:MAG: DUF4349 domain-containing protein [Oscillospiraceae bacterium]|nr:DUF4349 domain-containing protein [Oscillospiraceae bacterium]